MSDLVTDALKGMGPAGAFISLQLTAITGLVAAVVLQWKQANKVYGYRLAERDLLNKALTDNTTAINAMTRTAEERNKATHELAEAIDRMASAFERLNDRLGMQHENVKEQLKDSVEAIKSMAEAVRVNTGMVTDIRNYIQQPRRPR